MKKEKHARTYSMSFCGSAEVLRGCLHIRAADALQGSSWARAQPWIRLRLTRNFIPRAQFKPRGSDTQGTVNALQYVALCELIQCCTPWLGSGLARRARSRFGSVLAHTAKMSGLLSCTLYVGPLSNNCRQHECQVTKSCTCIGSNRYR